MGLGLNPTFHSQMSTPDQRYLLATAPNYMIFGVLVVGEMSIFGHFS